jgi:hypothetical protein
MNRTTKLLTYVAMIACLGLAAQVDAARWIVPAAAHAAGQVGTNWRTDLRLSNPTEEAVTVRVYLLRQNQDNGALGEYVDYTVNLGGQVVIEDVLDDGFDFSGNAALLIDCDEPKLVATTRTYNLVEEGSYGQFIPAVALSDALPAGTTGHVAYLAKSGDFRSNLGFAGTTASGGSVTVTIFDENGDELGTRTWPIAPFGQRQVNDIFGALSVAPSTSVRATVVATVPIVAYGSVVDERTGDPVAVMARTRSGSVHNGGHRCRGSGRRPRGQPVALRFSDREPGQRDGQHHRQTPQEECPRNRCDLHRHHPSRRHAGPGRRGRFRFRRGQGKWWGYPRERRADPGHDTNLQSE